MDYGLHSWFYFRLYDLVSTLLLYPLLSLHLLIDSRRSQSSLFSSSSEVPIVPLYGTESWASDTFRLRNQRWLLKRLQSFRWLSIQGPSDGAHPTFGTTVPISMLTDCKEWYWACWECHRAYPWLSWVPTHASTWSSSHFPSGSFEWEATLLKLDEWRWFDS